MDTDTAIYISCLLLSVSLLVQSFVTFWNRRAIRELLFLLQQGDFRNGNTHGGYDEGNVMCDNYMSRWEKKYKISRYDGGLR